MLWKEQSYDLTAMLTRVNNLVNNFFRMRWIEPDSHGPESRRTNEMGCYDMIRDQEVGGSNPLAPIFINPTAAGFIICSIH